MKIGQSQLRFEDDALVRGAGHYTSDVRTEGEAAMVLVRSPAAAGRIRALGTEAALAMPGVIAIFTGEEMAADGIGAFQPRMKHPGPDGGPMPVPLFRPLATGSVRYVGDPVAVVIAQTLAQASDAAEAVELDIEEKPAVVDALEALAPSAPKVWDDLPDNRCFRFEQGDRAAVEAAMAGAHRVVRQRLRITRVTAASIEPRGALAAYDGQTGRYRLELGTQAPHRMAEELASILGGGSDVHVIAQDCGGSFGMKNMPYPEYVAALWASRRVGRPIRWTAGRLESFQSDAHARDQWADAALALDAEGRFLALDVQITANLGAYLGGMTTHPPTGNVGGLAGVYRTPHIHVVVHGVFTNTQLTAPYRGAGRPEATYVIERMVDIAAAEMGIDRAELRRRNLISPDQMPFKTGLVFTYDSGDFPGILARTLETADWDGFEARRATSRQAGRLRGIGIASSIEIAGGPPGKPGPEFARLVIEPGARARLFVGSSDSGMGHATAFRQILGDRLGLEADRIEIVTGDTDLVPQGTGSFGSRTLSAAGTAISRSADEVVKRLRPNAAEHLEASVHDIVFSEGAYRVAGTDRRVGFSEVAATLTSDVEAEHFGGADDATFPNGCHVCEVEVDPDTGHVEVLRYLVVDDVGRVVNPLLMKGQILGGVAQGLGQALLEETVYEQGSGQLLSATFQDYAMPRAQDVPAVDIESFPVPTLVNALGVKGAGEAGTVGGLAAVMSAVCDALSPLGVRHFDMPATPQRVWRCLQETAPSTRELERVA